MSACLSQLELTFKSRNSSFQCCEKEKVQERLGEQVVPETGGSPGASLACITLPSDSGLWAQGLA